MIFSSSSSSSAAFPFSSIPRRSVVSSSSFIPYTRALAKVSPSSSTSPCRPLFPSLLTSPHPTMLPCLRRARDTKETPPSPFASLFLSVSPSVFFSSSLALFLPLLFSFLVMLHAAASCIRLRAERVEYLPSLEASPTLSLSLSLLLYPLFFHTPYLYPRPRRTLAQHLHPFRSSRFSRSLRRILFLSFFILLSYSLSLSYSMPGVAIA